ncbi:MAG: sigma-70 family RNA polymerase sigma factor [Oscillospiraceae bacterium]|nr:sigma-70 family RNA polymerase sigma factor [Oscillospiraceae bacterium]
MTDSEIIALYFSRSESAINETSKKYGAYCTAVAMNVLHDREDAEECVSDAFLKAWNAIPPDSPDVLSAFLAKITRNISINRYKAAKASKRGGNEVPLLLGELESCVPSRYSVEGEADSRLLGESIDRFLDTVGRNERVFFVRRYWFNESIAAIAERFGVGESRVAVSLYRTRNKLRVCLEKEGLI